jgi:subtilisin family serine protease
MKGLFLRMNARAAQFVLAACVVLVLAFFLTAILAPTSTATPQDETASGNPAKARPQFVPGEALVRYRSERIAASKTVQTVKGPQGRLLSIQMERFEGSEIVPGLRLAHIDADDTLAAIEALKQQPDVVYAEPNYRWYRTTAVPNDPCFPVNALAVCQNLDLYGLNKIAAPLAWDTLKGSRDTAQAGFTTPRVVVAVIDEGVDLTHADLVGNLWTNPGEIAGDNIDNDANGFVDDVHGYNFLNNTGTIPAANHATHVAGIVGATGDNATGVVGVNWQVGLMSLKFIGGTGATADAIRAAAYAKQMRDRWVTSGGTQGANVRVLNNSWGPDRRFGNGLSQALQDVVNSVATSGILFVTSAGNDALDNDVDPGYPASYNLPNLISVASTDRNDLLSVFSNFGAHTITMGAPGSGILSTVSGSDYASMSGTSMAAPFVSGAAALLLAANPNLTMQQLKSLLIFNGDPLASLAGKTLTGRRLNVANSFQALAENDNVPPGTVTNLHVNSQNGRSLNVGWIASGDDGAAGQASLYQISFTDATSGAVIFLKSVIPTASGTVQAIDVKLPYRHTSGTLSLREFDNVGNEGVPATVAVSVSLLEGDPYITSVVGPAALSTGGTPLNTNCDDCNKTQALPFNFPFFGENFNSVKVTSNGALYFSTPLANDSGSSAVALSQNKMVAGLWMDLRTDRHPGTDDIFVVTPDPSRIIFRWQGVTFGLETPETEFPVSFEIELRSNGTILTRYGAGNTHLKPVVGISAGEPDTYVITSHTSETTEISLTNAGEVTFLPRSVGITSSVQFSASQYTVNEDDGSATITVNRDGDTTTQATVDYVTVDGQAKQKSDYMFGSGTVNFAAGETSKTIPVLIVNDTYQEGAESFSISLLNPVGSAIGTRNVSSITINPNDATPTPVHPLDNPDARFFVRQHYMDFLGREPDADGLNFWAGQITACGNDQACVSNARVNVSAAFFLSIEFQETGYLVYRTYKAAFGDAQGSAVINNVHTAILVPRVQFNDFLPETARIARGVQVGIGNWQQQLEANKQAYMLGFVQRTDFQSSYPATMTADQFVTQLNSRAGNVLSPAEKTSLVDFLGSTPNDLVKRAQALRAVAEDQDLKNLEKNRAFVLMQYFGYLRRNPNDTPDTDHSGWKFWLDKLDEHNGNYNDAQMVLAFLLSFEYRNRFGP